MRNLVIWILSFSFSVGLIIAWGWVTGNPAISLTALGVGYLVFLCIGLAFLAGGQRWVLTGSEAPNASGRKMGTRLRVISFFVATDVLLFLLVLVAPYYGSYPLPVDPRDWPPFAWEGPGSLVYQASFPLWIFNALFLLPLIATQGLRLKKTWLETGSWERMMHGTLLFAGLVISLFTATLGQNILYWLVD